MAKRELRAWAIVLAAGDGSRLASLTRALYGECLPKQFAALNGARSLLQETLDRIGMLVPPERTVVVVSSRYEALARRQLRGYPGIDLVTQPRNLGTGPGILLPLARIRARDPGASVAIFPSDHHYRDPQPVLEGVRTMITALKTKAFPATLLGVEAWGPETEYGWIEPGEPLGSHALARVEGFVEKPSLLLATRLLAKGALWNTLICVARVADVWSLLRSRLPGQTAAFEIYSRCVGSEDAGRLLDVLYEGMEPANLSHDVLAHVRDLAVLPVAGSGFTDWGTPERVFKSLDGTSAHARLLERMSGAVLAHA